MGFKKAILVLLLLIILTMGAASAVDTNTTSDNLAATEDTNLELSENDDFEDKLGIESSNHISDTGNSTGKLADLENVMSLTKDNHKENKSYDDILSVQNDLNVLNTNYGTYSGLATEIGSGGNIELNCDYYTYDSGDTITISTPNSVINGKGAIIDMAGSPSMRAFEVTASDVTIKNLTIKNANYTGNGGAIYFSDSGTVENCNFINNTAYLAGVEGGAIWFGGLGTVTNCNFINNTANHTYGDGVYGGAIYFNQDGSVSNCNFTNNRAGYANAVFLSNGTVTNCNFNNNSEGFYAVELLNGTIENCNFINNSAVMGGAVALGNGTIKNCNFINNSAILCGGAAFLINGTMINCTFINNSAASGDAVAWENATEFIPSECLGTGGAIWFGGSGTVENCKFTDNSAMQGGAIYFNEQSGGNVINSNFINCSAELGKAIYANNNTIISNCNFETQGSESLDELVVGGIISNCTVNGNKEKTEPNMTVTVDDIIYGENATFTVILPSDATGILNITVDNKVMFTADVGNEPIIAEFSGLDIGTYIANITYTGDLKYLPANASKTFTVNSKANKTFTDLKNLIDATSPGDTIKLEDDYINDGSISSNGITISKAITIDGKGHTLNANGKSRVFYIGYSTVTLMNIVFKNGYCGGDGGAIVFGGMGNVLNCSFVNNTASGFGGAIYFDYDSIGTVENCNFVNNTALEFDGGAIYFFYSSGTVDNCNFTNHTARWGGAVEFVGTGKVTNSNFVNNHATNEGGAVYFDVDTFGNVENCSFTCNTATDGGAVYFANGGNASNCDFADNSATGNGGSVYFSSVGKIENSRFNESKYTVYGGTVINCTFNMINFGKFSDLSSLIESIPENGVLELDADYQNDGSVSGDGISISKSLTIDGKGHTLDAKGKSRIFKLSADNIILKNITFINGYSTECGGAIYNTGNFKISSCNFINCFAGDCGGAIYNGGGISNISSCNFTDCTANDGGGGIYNDEDSHYITFCSFVNCSCNNYGGAIGNGGIGDRYIGSCSFVNCSSRNYGGAIDNGADCNIILCSFVNCSAGFGGAIFVNYLGVCEDINSCSFSDCSASNSGGAIYTRGDCQIISSCSFTRCSAEKHGGVIYYMGTDGTVINCIFINCSAKNGGSIYWNAENGIINTSTFNYSTATSNGGAIYWDAHGGEITNSTFTNSHARNGGAIYVPENNNVEIKSSIFENNYAEEESGAIYGGTVDDDCTFKNNTGIAVNTTTIISINETAVYTGNDISITTIVLNQKGGFVNTGTVEIYINSKLIATIPTNTEYIHTTGDLGTYHVLAKFNAESDYYSSSGTAEFTVIPVDIPEEIETNNEGIFTLEFPDDAEGTLTVFIDGTKYKVYDITGGILKIDLSYKKGKYNITFEYSGDKKYPAFKKDTNASIQTNPSIKASNTKVLYSAGTTYKITVYKNKGILAKSVSVTIKLNNKKLKPIKTNSKGIASFKVTQTPGTYKLKITTLGTTVTKTLTVKHIVTLKAVKVKKSAKKLILQATLSKVNKKYLKKKTVTFKFNGKKYKAKTNSKGVAKVTIKKSVLKKLKAGKKVTYQATYLKDTVKKTVKVKK